MTKKQKISYLNVGRKITAVIDGASFPVTIAGDAKEKLLRAIESFNLAPTDTKKQRIIKMLQPETKKAEETKLKTVSKAKHDIKEVKRVIKKATKEIEKELKQLPSATVTQENIVYFQNDPRFILKNNNVYLAPFTTVEMHKVMVDRIEKFIKSGTDLTPLINFWKLALMNPNPIARNKMFEYIMKKNLTITPKGYLVTYRMVKDTGKLDARGKKIYTSAYTGEEHYFMGESFSLPRTECDEDGAQDCSRGLHTGTPEFIGIVSDKRYSMDEDKGGVGTGYGIRYETTKAAHPTSFGTGYDSPKEQTKTFNNCHGNQAIICLINPMHIVSVPNSDTRKMRSCEIYFCRETTANEVIDMVEKDYLIYDDQYFKYEAAELEKLLKATKLERYVDTAALGKSQSARTLAMNKLKELKASLAIRGDKVSQDLTPEEINAIIKSRIE